MTLPSNDEIRELANAVQLSISSEITGVHRVRDGALEIGFARNARKDPRLATLARMVKGEFRESGKILRIENAEAVDWPRITSFLLVTRLARKNVRVVESDPQYRTIFVEGRRSSRAATPVGDVASAANIIFKAVESKGMTLRTLAEKTGLTQVTLSKFKAGNDIRLSSLLKIAKALDLQLTIE